MLQERNILLIRRLNLKVLFLINLFWIFVTSVTCLKPASPPSNSPHVLAQDIIEQQNAFYSYEIGGIIIKFINPFAFQRILQTLAGKHQRRSLKWKVLAKSTCSRPSTVALALSSSTPTYKGSFFREILARSSTFRVCVAEKSMVCLRAETYPYKSNPNLSRNF